MERRLHSPLFSHEKTNSCEVTNDYFGKKKDFKGVRKACD